MSPGAIRKGVVNVKSLKIICRIAQFDWSRHDDDSTACTKSYLRNIAKACVEVDRDPSPKMLQTIQGVFRLAPATIDELERDHFKA
jgi:hypothetical protein